MNVYDFDKTIFVGDTEERFFHYLFYQKGMFWEHVNVKTQDLLLHLKLAKLTPSRERRYDVLRRIPDIGTLVEAYWDANERYLMDWYLRVKQPTDVIASGTPRFLMEPIVKRLGLTRLVATEMDPHTGKIDGEYAVCFSKVTAFEKQFSLSDIDRFYSDNYSDHYLAEYAKEAYIVTGDGEMTEWNAYFRAHPKQMRSPY